MDTSGSNNLDRGSTRTRLASVVKLRRAECSPGLFSPSCRSLAALCRLRATTRPSPGEPCARGFPSRPAADPGSSRELATIQATLQTKETNVAELDAASHNLQMRLEEATAIMKNCRRN